MCYSSRGSLKHNDDKVSVLLLLSSTTLSRINLFQLLFMMDMEDHPFHFILKITFSKIFKLTQNSSPILSNPFSNVYSSLTQPFIIFNNKLYLSFRRLLGAPLLLFYGLKIIFQQQMQEMDLALGIWTRLRKIYASSNNIL